MRFDRNIPGWERGLRALTGVALLIAAAVVPMPALAMWLIIAAGGMALATSLVGFCPACALVGRRLT